MAKRGRNLPKGRETATGEFIQANYCTKCMKTKRTGLFYQALDFYTHQNGLSHICKDCQYEIYDDLNKDFKTIQETLNKFCQIINIPFQREIAFSVEEYIREKEEQGTEIHPVGIYQQRIKMAFRDRDTSGDFYSLSLTYSEEVNESKQLTEEEEIREADSFWDGIFTVSQLSFLNREYNRFKESFAMESPSEIYWLKQLIKKMLLKKEEENNENIDLKMVSDLEKEMQRIMKTLNISPDQIQKSNAGTSKKIYGSWLKDIETFTPAEWLEREGKERFSDVDNIELYYDNFFIRTLKNLISGIPNFMIKNEDGSEKDWSI